MQISFTLSFSIGFAHIGRVGSVAVTISIAIERYMSVCYPTTSSSCHKRLLFPLPIVFSVLYNVPKFFEIVKCSEEEINRTMIVDLLSKQRQNSGDTTNSTADITLFVNGRNETIALDVFDQDEEDRKSLCDPYGTRATSLRNNKWYIIFYVFLSELFFVEIMPWITVVILNISTWKGITSFQKKRQALKEKSRNNAIKGKYVDLELLYKNVMFFLLT